MNEHLISLDELWELRGQIPIVDARSENEFQQSHIPGSFNLPILTNEERIRVGTLYKKEGSLKATIEGFKLVGPRFYRIQNTAIENFPEKKVLIYCWRGGMRSQILSWLLSMIGFQVYRLVGGYKAYRTYTFQLVRKDWNLLVLGGKTGVGKTQLLNELASNGEQILDLEAIANHRGSAFGGIGQKPQPSVEQFENLMAEELRQKDPNEIIWLENESQRIGKIIINQKFFECMESAPLIAIEKSEKERIELIKEVYSTLPKEELIAAVTRLKKKLGGLRTTQAIEDIINDQHESWISNMLVYYDKSYQFDLDKHHPKSIQTLDLEGLDVEKSCRLLIHTKNLLNGKQINSAH